MKISAFAKKFALNVSTVRYYINNGLLVPSKKNEQYEFGQECIKDMEQILEYKKFHFSLEEIQLLFFLEKASRFQDEVVLEVCADILQAKKKELIEEREELNAAIDDLELEISKLPVSVSHNHSKFGIPFSFIPYLYCPHCQTPLKLDSASLSEGSLQKGELWCDCGYKAKIEDGLILCEEFGQESPFKAFTNIDSVFAMMQEFSTGYRMLIAKAYLWMYNQMSPQLETPPYIMAGPFTFNFLLEYIEKLGDQHTYIIVDPSLKRIEKIKQYLSNEPYNIIYIAGDPSQAPIRHGQVDLYIDDFSTSNYRFTYNSFATEQIAPLLCKKGHVVGIFTTYEKAPTSLQNFKLDHPDFDPGKMTLPGLKFCWEKEGVQFCEKKSLGETNTTEKHFSRNLLGEPIQVWGYCAEK